MGNTIFTSETAQVIISIIPIVGIAIGGIVVFFYILWHHHEVKLRITNGNYKTRPFDLQTFSLIASIMSLKSVYIISFDANIIIFLIKERKCANKLTCLSALV